MGKRGANCLDDPSLIEVNNLTSCHRTMSITSCSSAALTLLALKQESPSPSSSATSVFAYGSGESSFLRSNVATPDDSQRGFSMCSSVTDDDGSSCSGDGSSVESPRSGHELIGMALVRPKLRLVSFHSIASPSLSIPSWKVPPEGRPLPPPGRLPKGLIIESGASLMSKAK